MSQACHSIPAPSQFDALINQQVYRALRRMPPGMLGMDAEDLRQEALIVYVKFCRDFDPGRGCLFITGFYQRLWQHLWRITRKVHRRPTLTSWNEDDPDGAMLEDIAVDRSRPSAREEVGGGLAEIGTFGLSRDAWRLARAILDPPEGLVAYCSGGGKGRKLLVQAARWLGIDRTRRDELVHEIATKLGRFPRRTDAAGLECRGKTANEGVDRWLRARRT